jgi:geranylgeranyl diphosphate synthase type II
MPHIKKLDIVDQSTQIDQIREEINAYLQQYYTGRYERARELNVFYGRLWDGLTQTHLAGGKRLRPYLVVLAFEALGGRGRSDIMPACAAVELLHAAMLIHDDIIDRDYYRHGKPNLPGIYRQHYRTVIANETERGHFADSAALLGGDILIGDAFELIARTSLEPSTQMQLVRLLSEAIYNVAGGELLDVEASLYPPDIMDAIQIAELKTAFYSFSLPLEVGATLAGAGQSSRRQLREIGKNIGIAFQLADDLLGMYGSAKETGKPVGNDLREGKRSLLMQRGLALAADAERAELLAALGNHNNDHVTLRRVCAILDSCGARQEVESLMEEYYKRTADLLADLPIAEADRDAFLQLAQRTIWRRS